MEKGIAQHTISVMTDMVLDIIEQRCTSHFTSYGILVPYHTVYEGCGAHEGCSL